MPLLNKNPPLAQVFRQDDLMPIKFAEHKFSSPANVG
jgi:hypothetical protein